MRILTFCAFLTLTACSTMDPSPDYTRLCTDTVNEYAHARDAGDVDRARILFTDNATVMLFGNVQNGRDEILAALKVRAEGAVSRHMIGSVLITRTGPDTAKGESYVLLIADDDGPRPRPLTDSSLLAAGTYVDTFVIQNGQCRIATRNVVIDFQQN